MRNLINILRQSALVFVLLAAATVICLVYVFLFSQDQVAERLAECKMLWKSGDLANARRELLKLHDENDSNADVAETLAALEQGSGNATQAMVWFRRVPESDKNRAAAARLQAAQLAMQLGLARDTESLAQECLRLDPNLAGARRLLMRFYFTLQQHPQLIEQSVELDRRGQLTPVELLMRCLAHRAAWDDDEHIKWLEQCLNIDSSSNTVRAALARNYSARDLARETWQVLKAAPSPAPEAWRILLARSEQEIVEGRFEKALELLAELESEADLECRVWLARARALLETGQEEQARQAIDNVVKLDPYDPAPSYMLSRISATHGNASGDGNAANVHFQRSQQLKELMGRLSRITEAFNPAYHSSEPISVTMQKAQQSFIELGFEREAQILANSAQITNSPPVRSLARVTLADLKRSPAVALKNSERPGSNDLPWSKDRKTSGEIRFVDIAAKIGLSFRYETGHSQYLWLMETLGGGVAVLDYDLDGWADIHLTQAGPLPIQGNTGIYADRLFRNVAAETVHDVSQAALPLDSEYGHGCAVGDFDNDGFPDLVVCNYGELLVLQNQGDGTFVDARAPTQIESTKWSTSAAFADIDRDGDLDLYVVQYLEAPFGSLNPCMHEGGYTSCRPFAYPGEPDIFWENQGDGRFANRTQEYGFIDTNGKGLGVAIADFDRSGQDSIFVANDTTPNLLFTRVPSSSPLRFEETAGINGIAVNSQGLTEACMGVGLGDVNGDGRFDLHITTFQGETSTLFLSLGSGGFSDSTEQAGLAMSSRNRMGWGCQFFDVDCNGDLDLFVANGHLHGPPQLAQLYYNQGRGRFAEVSQTAGDYFRKPWLGRSVATIDWNRDLLTDLVVTYQEENTSVLQNVSGAGNRLALRLIGVDSNRDGIGALVEATIGQRTLHFTFTRGGGYFAANDPVLLIGCGVAEQVDELRVVWPSGHAQSLRNVATGRSYVCLENQGVLIPSSH